jgi:O-6-methylguanine DNA methyltransferase
VQSINFATYEAWGGIGFIISEDNKVTKISWPIFTNQEAAAKLSKSLDVSQEQGKVLSSQKKDLENYFSGKRVDFLSWDLSFFSLTKFQRSVAMALIKVPYGQTISYKELAILAGFPNASRAVGSALSKNPLPIISPCHRVIKSDGSLGGWSGPQGWKERLLEMERLS